MENKGSDQPPVPKAPKRIEHWDYDTYFKEYLLLLATKGRLGLESSSKYPETIELGKAWHETLNQIRSLTAEDGIERWAFVGVKPEKRGVFLPKTPIKGERDNVPVEAMKKLMDLAKAKSGISEFLGDMHSHPIDFFTTMRHKLASGAGDKHKIIDGLSWGDYYFLLNHQSQFFMGVTSGNINFFVFRTSESTGLGVSRSGFTLEHFEKYWMEIGKNLSYQEEQIQIAKRHRLVLYHGQKDEDLVKVFPH